jgi:hypothetical protein
MNPDQEQPQIPIENPTPAPTPAPVPTPIPIANPFGTAPVSSEPTPAPLPGQPIASVGSSPNTNLVANLMGDPKKKKLIVLIGIIVAILVVLGVAALILVGILFPSKADYRDAALQFNKVSSAYSDLSSNASKLQYDVSGSTTDTEFTNDGDSVNKSLQAFQDANKTFADMKAVKIGDGKKLYDTYQGKVTLFVAYANDIFTSVKSFHPVAKACADVSTITLLNECVTALNNIGSVPNADLNQYVTTIQTQYKAYLDVKTKISAITDPYGSQYDNYKAIRDQGYAIQDKISSASSDLRSNLSKHANDIDPASSANALGDFLVKKES